MVQGTIFLNLASPRSSLFKDIIEYLGLDIEIAPKTDPRLAANFPLQRTPSYLGSDGFKLHETIAILVFLISLKPAANTYNFYGKSGYETAQVWKWVSFTNSDMVNAFVHLLMLAKTQADKEKALSELETYAGLVEKQLRETEYLVSNEITLADIFAVQTFRWGFQTCWDAKWLSYHPYLENWFYKVIRNDPIASRSLKTFSPVEKAKF
ncbi:hypothetical protein DAMA08_032480 [Martiniozyma asiatica (nom. inval.)]|nr:hypothetical protein DAMA08_032480 [Martiniozyma asiatica]